MDIERDSDHFHGGAGASASIRSSSSSLGKTSFYSLSPCSSSTSATFDPDILRDGFQTSGRLHLNETDDETRQCHSLPPSPLKLPPRLQHAYHFDSSNPRSSKYSPQSSVSVREIRISRQIFKSDEFDPFLIAMKNVTVEGSSVSHASSFSSVWVTSPNESSRRAIHVGPSISMGSIEVMERPIFEDSNNDVGLSVSRRLGEPRGIKKARAMRLVKMGCCEQSEPIISSTNGPIREIGACLRMKKPKDENKIKNRNEPFWNVTFCFKKVKSGKGKKDKSVYKLVRLKIVLYRPRLSFCLGN